MKPATDLKTFYKNMSPSRFLTQKEREFYVNVYDQKIKELRLDLQTLETPNLTIYVSGQYGSGKTTALNFLPDQAINEDFEVILLMGSELFDLDDLEIVDILLMLSNQLVQEYEELQRIFRDRLERIAKSLQGRYEEVAEKQDGEETNKGIGVKGYFRTNPFSAFLSMFGAEINAFGDYKLNYEKRRVVREVFIPSITDLLELTNEIIELYLDRKNPSRQKELLIIFHELNHIKNLKNINRLFIRNRFYLEGIKARKVITVPVSLIPDPSFNAEVRFLGLKTQPSRLDGSPASRDEAEKNCESLKTIIRKRIAADANILDEEGLDLAVQESGGNIRQLVSILFFTARRVITLDGHSIAKNDISFGLTEMRRMLERSLVTSDKIELLDYIGRNSVPAASDDLSIFMDCALANQVMIYENAKYWYDLNPLIRETVTLYARRLRDEKREQEHE